jgi:hypothetical protein
VKLAYNYLFITSAVLCLLYFIGFFKYGKTYKIFTLYIVGVLIIDFVASNLWDWFKIYNIFTSHFYDLFQFVILSYFYATLLQTKKQLLAVFILLIILPVFLLSRYVFNPQMFFEYSLLETYLATMPIIIYATMHLYNNLGQKTEFYYANLGILLYLFSSTFIFLFYELNSFFDRSNIFYKNLTAINLALQFIKFGFFFYQLKLIYFNKDGRYN